jgi:two-component system, OmpR family, KDP operon response regulator KdpE
METQSGADTFSLRLLIVACDQQVRRTLHSALHSAGFDIGEARSGEEAAALCAVVRYEAVLIEVGTPEKGDIEICREIRRLLPRAALFVLSDNDDHDRKMEAFDAGADDYVTKPIHVPELTARVRSAIRCIRTCAAQSDQLISIGAVELHAERRQVLKAGKPVHLTSKEFDLLHYMMSRPGLPIARSRLLEAIWGSEHVEQLEYLRNFMRQLRKKLEDDPGNPKYLLTSSCIGYRFTDSAQASHAQ